MLNASDPGIGPVPLPENPGLTRGGCGVPLVSGINGGIEKLIFKLYAYIYNILTLNNILVYNIIYVNIIYKNILFYFI
jgi:hypothetical protein